MKKAKIFMISALAISTAHAFNLPKQPTKSYDCETCEKLSREPLQDKWSISSQPLDTKISNLQKSFGFKKKITSKQLQQGYTISTLAPGAIIRIVPLGKHDVPSLQLTTPENKTLSLKEASQLYSEDGLFGDERLSPKHQRMLVLKSELGAGDFVIKSDDNAPSNNETYLISVLDKTSNTYIEVSTDMLHYQYGQMLHASIVIRDDLGSISEDDVTATAIGPEGQNIPLSIKKVGKHALVATATLDSELNDRGENWYVEVNADIKIGDRTISRSGHTAFSYTVPSASLISVKKIASKPLTFVATVDVATASRYALQSVLYRKSAKGTVTPIETSQRAQWLEKGMQLIQFTFDNSNQFAEDSLYLGYFRLTDYGQMSCVYQHTQPVKLSQLVE